MFGIGLGTRLLQKRDLMWFPMNEAPNNAGLWPIAFMTESLTSSEAEYSNIEKP